MRIEEVLKLINSLSPVGRKILEFLESHPDEIFSPLELREKLGISTTCGSFYFNIRRLIEGKKIRMIKLKGKVYYGSERAIRELERRLNENK